MMQLGRVIGHATSTIKHATLAGLRLVLVQPQNAAGQADGDIQLAVDRLGVAVGHTVLLNTDGRGARELVGKDKTPARWFIAAIVDQVQQG
jgi:microcompartment protein CcmK/EutM